MNKSRFKGERGWVYVGGIFPGLLPKIDIHLYARDDSKELILVETIDPEDLVAALNELEGFTASYVPPKSKVDLSKHLPGTVIQFDRYGPERAMKTSSERWMLIDAATTVTQAYIELMIIATAQRRPDWYEVVVEGGV